MTKRLCLMDDDRLQLRPISIRFWALFILALVCGVVLATSYGAWMVVRADYVRFNSMLNESVTRNDRLMAICVMANESTKKQVKKQVPANIGGEEK